MILYVTLPARPRRAGRPRWPQPAEHPTPRPQAHHRASRRTNPRRGAERHTARPTRATAREPRSPPAGARGGTKRGGEAGPGGRPRHGRAKPGTAARARRATATAPPNKRTGRAATHGAAGKQAQGEPRSERRPRPERSAAAAQPERRATGAQRATRPGQPRPAGAGGPPRSARRRGVGIEPQPRSGKAGPHTFLSPERSAASAGQWRRSRGLVPARPTPTMQAPRLYLVSRFWDTHHAKKRERSRSPAPRFSSFPRIPNLAPFGVVVRNVFHAGKLEVVFHGLNLLLDVREFVMGRVLIQKEYRAMRCGVAPPAECNEIHGVVCSTPSPGLDVMNLDSVR